MRIPNLHPVPPTDLSQLGAAFRRRVERNGTYRGWVLATLFDRQTPEERRVARSRVANGTGFTAPDARALSPLAEKARRGVPLSGDEQRCLQKRLPKYWRQFIAASLQERTQAASQNAQAVRRKTVRARTSSHERKEAA